MKLNLCFLAVLAIFVCSATVDGRRVRVSGQATVRVGRDVDPALDVSEVGAELVSEPEANELLNTVQDGAKSRFGRSANVPAEFRRARISRPHETRFARSVILPGRRDWPNRPFKPFQPIKPLQPNRPFQSLPRPPFPSVNPFRFG